MSSEELEIREIGRKREEKRLRKQQTQRFFESKIQAQSARLDLSVPHKKFLNKLPVIQACKPATKVEPFTKTSYKLFGLTNP